MFVTRQFHTKKRLNFSYCPIEVLDFFLLDALEEKYHSLTCGHLGSCYKDICPHYKYLTKAANAGFWVGRDDRR